MDKEFDFVVFGATGFTGQFVVEDLHQRVKSSPELAGKTLAIAGRDRAKLDALAAKFDPRPSVIIADVRNESSMNEMCRRARVVLNCVGPYRFFGLQVVRACVENTAHYVDITGEPEFMERSYLQYNDEAKRKGVLIVHTCGFDSIPADLGVVHNAQEFARRGGVCSSVEGYLDVRSKDSAKMVGHYTTYECAVHGFSNVGALRKLRSERGKKEGASSSRPPVIGPKVVAKQGAFWSKAVNKWCLPFPGADASVVRQSQQHLWETRGDGRQSVAPVQFGAYFTVRSRWRTFQFALFFVIISFLTKFKLGVKLLLAFPRLFSFGTFSHAGPTQKQREATSFRYTFDGKGYKTDEEGKALESQPMAITTTVDGPEPGYVATPVCLVESAVSIVCEKDKIAPAGGVLTPASAFRDTTIIERLNERGVKFGVSSVTV